MPRMLKVAPFNTHIAGKSGLAPGSIPSEPVALLPTKEIKNIVSNGVQRPSQTCTPVRTTDPA